MLSKKDSRWIGKVSMILLGMTFVVAGVAKAFSGTTPFEVPFIPQVLTSVAYSALPYVEIAVGCLLIIGFATKLTISLSALLIICFAAVNIMQIRLGIENCASCFGGVASVTPTFSLLLDGLMAMLVVISFFCYRGTPWFFGIHKGRECQYV